ncbi:MAG: hypothetical protein V1647_00210, partial [Pseudomonadota bacterium]
TETGSALVYNLEALLTNANSPITAEKKELYLKELGKVITDNPKLKIEATDTQAALKELNELLRKERLNVGKFLGNDGEKYRKAVLEDAEGNLDDVNKVNNLIQLSAFFSIAAKNPEKFNLKQGCTEGGVAFSMISLGFSLKTDAVVRKYIETSDKTFDIDKVRETARKDIEKRADIK